MLLWAVCNGGFSQNPSISNTLIAKDSMKCSLFLSSLQSTVKWTENWLNGQAQKVVGQHLVGGQ